MKNFAKIVLLGLAGIILLGVIIFLYDFVDEKVNPKPTPYDLTTSTIKDLPKVSFSHAGTLKSSNEGKMWKLIYKEKGEPAEVSLRIIPQTVCMLKEQQMDCTKLPIQDGDLVNVDGVKSLDSVEVVKIQKVN